jgi:type I restriction enzyme, R subunit
MDQNNLNEQTASQLPALHLLQNLGFIYLSPEEARLLRRGRLRSVLLESILVDWLRDHNRIQYKGKNVPFADGNIYAAVEALKIDTSDGLVHTNEAIYDLLTLGKSLQQSMNGDLRSFTLHYIDWERPGANVFHVAEEFSVEREGSDRTRRPDLVLFVNGIPFVVIECKSPHIKDPLKQAISQNIRNQKDGNIPHLFHYAQIVMAICGNAAQYATTGTEAKFWSAWREKQAAVKVEEDLQVLVNLPLSNDQIIKLCEASRQLDMFDRIPAVQALNTDRMVTEQDRSLYALCRPERLLELTQRFILFDGAEKKIARYQQFFAVNKIMRRIRDINQDGGRTGGVVWHTQGSGKSLTMVMLAKSIAMQENISDYKIVLVTDRVDLDDQLKNNFKNTGCDVVQAATGKDLSKLLSSPRSHIISTVINKFEAAVGENKPKLVSPNIFVLVDEGHRTQYGTFHARMRQVLPKACYIGFTGTPVLKKNKHTVARFGGMIDTYTISEAVRDKAVVELLYEGRHVHQVVNKEEMDKWFERETEGISDAQADYLKNRFAANDPLNKAAQKVREIAWDISVHYRDNWQNTGFKGQLVTQDKQHALLFRHYLKDIGIVNAEVLISGPDEREGETDVHSDSKELVNIFWKEIISKYATEKAYNKQLIDAFKHGDELEIIIVVDKLLTGFDAPRNAVLYLTRALKDHALLQAIARVNRLYEGKEYGYIIDYAGVLANLDDALEVYGHLPDFDPADLEDILTDIRSEIAKLPQAHTNLLDTFKTIQNKTDLEEYEQFLVDPEMRDKFYDRLSVYAKTLSIAFASADFLENTQPEDITMYKHDLKFFTKLRASVKRRYAETLDYAPYEKKIQKLLDVHVYTESTQQITPPVNIFDEKAFAEEVEKLESVTAKADTIAYRTRKTIYEHMGNDPVFYQKFSVMLQKVIEDYLQRRLDENAYLARVTEIMSSVVNRSDDGLPAPLKSNDVAKAYYGILNRDVAQVISDKKVLADLAINIDRIIKVNSIVQWTENQDIENKMRIAIEDYLFEVAEQKGFTLDFDVIDRILDSCIKIAKHRETSGD